MSSSSDQRDNSLWNFPADLLAVSGIPFVVVTVVSTSFMSMRGTAWIIAAAASLGLTLLGVAFLFYAKLPLYRQRRFFTFGLRAIPASRHVYYRWGCGLCVLGCVVMMFLSVGSTLWKMS